MTSLLSSLAVAAPSPILRVLTLGDGNFSFSAALVALHEGKGKAKRAKQNTTGETAPADERGEGHASDAEANKDAAGASAAAAAGSAAACPAAASSVDSFLATHRLCLVASSFDSAAALHAKYPEAAKLIDKVRTVGATSKRLSGGTKDANLRTVLHDVDATNLQRTLLPQLSTAEAASSAACVSPADGVVPASAQFDVIIFNHPHSGAEDLAVHASLLAHFFHSAAGFLRADADASRKSQVHVTLCQRQPEDWRLLESAGRHGFRLMSRSEFLEAHYPSYETKRHHVKKTFAKRTIQRMELFIFERDEQHTADATAPVFARAEQDPTFQHNALSAVIPLPAFRPTLPYEQAIAAIQAASSSAASTAASASAAAPSLRTDITCSICSKGFSSERGLFYHMQQMHPAGRADDGEAATHAPQWNCMQCDPPRSFHDESAMQQHRIAIHMPGTSTAAPSVAASSAAEPTSTSAASSASDLHPCSICSMSFSSLDLLRDHLSGVPPVAPVALLECAVCGRLFPNARALTQHEKAAAVAPEKHVRIVLAPIASSHFSHSDPALIGLAAQGRSKMKKLRGMVANAGSGQSVVERLGVKKGQATATGEAAASAVPAVDSPSVPSSVAVPAASASSAPCVAASAPVAVSPSFPGLDDELVGSARDLDGITEAMHVWRRFQVVGSAPHTIQGVFAIRFSKPPPVEEPEEQAKIDAAPREMCVAVCLPAGYALVQPAAGESAIPAAGASSICPSFSFVTPLLLKDALHTLLMAASPVYAAWKAAELSRKLLELFANQSHADDAADD